MIVTPQTDGSFWVQIIQIQEPVQIYAEFVNDTESLQTPFVWAVGNRLYIQTDQGGQAQVYTLAGELVTTIAVASDRLSTVEMQKGVYLINLHDRKYKVAIHSFFE